MCCRLQGNKIKLTLVRYLKKRHSSFSITSYSSSLSPSSLPLLYSQWKCSLCIRWCSAADRRRSGWLGPRLLPQGSDGGATPPWSPWSGSWHAWLSGGGRGSRDRVDEGKWHMVRGSIRGITERREDVESLIHFLIQIGIRMRVAVAQRLHQRALFSKKIYERVGMDGQMYKSSVCQWLNIHLLH